MRVETLEAFNIDANLLAIWERTVGDELLPVQERAVKEFGLFGEQNLIVFSPTSSGKTFVGEMAAVQAARRAGKVFYLVPQKALAEEKFEEFRTRYGDAGIDVVVSSRDRRDFDDAILSKNFGIAVVVFEKLQNLLVAEPSLADWTGLVVVDELQLITDPARGPNLELLLTKLITARKPPRIIGLSAVLGKAEALAEWLSAKLIVETQRPLELRKGVLCEGTFVYREHNSGEIGTEPFPDIGKAEDHETICAAVDHLVQKGEQVLVFEETRLDSVKRAWGLADRLQLPSVDSAIEDLRDGEETQARDNLLHVLGSSVAFHNSDLSLDERRIVEHAFRAGEIRVLCATSTLAVGVNLPTKNVIVPSCKWDYLKRYERWSRMPITKSEYENMSGRAGRYSLSDGFGRSILVTGSRFQAKAWMDVFVSSDFESIEPMLKDAPLEDHVVDLVASRVAGDRSGIIRLLSQSFTGRVHWRENLSHEEFVESVDRATGTCADAGLLEIEQSRISCTKVGRACAATGIAVGTARKFADWARTPSSEPPDPLEVLMLATATPDADSAYVNMRTREAFQLGFRDRLLTEARQRDLLDRPVFDLAVRRPEMLVYEEEKRIKKVLILLAWMEELRTAEIEQGFRIWAGAIRRVADEYGWLIEALARVCGAVGWSQERCDAVARIAKRVTFGVHEDGLELVRLLRVRGFGRALLRRLVDAELKTEDLVREASPEALRDALRHRGVAKRLHDYLHPKKSKIRTYPQPSSSRMILRVAESTGRYGTEKVEATEKPDLDPALHFSGRCRKRRYLVVLDGHEIWVTSQVFRVLAVLAARHSSSPHGWVHTQELKGHGSSHQALWRTRKALDAHLAGFVENDGHGSYRLNLGTRSVTWDRETIVVYHAELAALIAE